MVHAGFVGVSVSLGLLRQPISSPHFHSDGLMAPLPVSTSEQ